MRRDHSPRDDDLRQELLELCFDCHPDPEPLRRRIGEDAEVRALFEEMQETAALLGEAANDDPVAGVAPGSAPRPARGRGPWLRRACIAAAVLLIAVPAAIWADRELRHARAIDAGLRLIVAGPRVVPAGAAARYRAETWSPDGQPAEATLRWRLVDPSGRAMHEGSLSTTGAATIELPPQQPGASPQRLEILASRKGGEQRATLDLRTARPMPLVHLTTDKPAYRPGEPMRLRAAVLDPSTLAPQAENLRVRVKPPTGGQHDFLAGADAHGVLSTVWTVPPGVAGGRWSIEIRDAGGSFLLDRREVLVLAYEPPKLATNVELDRKSYAPGARGAAELAVTRQAGGAADGASVDASLVLDGNEVWSGGGTLDREGRAVFSFRIPPQVERGAGRFVARIRDGGVVETVVEPFVVPTGRVVVAFFPEGGDLVADLPGRVYAEVRDALDRPISARGRVVDAVGNTVAPFRTLHQGRARFALTPRAGERYRLVLEEPRNDPIPLPAVAPRGVVLTAPESIGPRETARLAVAAIGEGPWIACAFSRGRLVGQTAFQGSGTRTIELDLLATAAGVLRLTVFDHRMKPVAERLVHRRSDRRLAVSLRPEKSVLRPGDRQRVAVETTNETGEPVRALVGLTVSDRAVRDFADEHRIGIEDHVWLCADVEELEEIEDFVLAGPEAERNIDLLLGTRGWRRFLWAKPAEITALRQREGIKAERLLVQEGWAQVPAVVDAGGDVSQLARESNEARGWTLLAMGVVFGALALVLFVRCLRRVPPPVPVAAAVTTAICVLAAVGLWEMTTLGVGTGAPASRLQSLDTPPSGAYAGGSSLAGPIDLNGTGQGTGLLAPPQTDQGIFGGAPIRMAQPSLDTSVRWKAGFAWDRIVSGTGDLGRLAALRRSLTASEETIGLRLFRDDARFRMSPNGVLGYYRVQAAQPYAHAYTATEERRDFTETVYWHPSVETDDNGCASVEFQVSDRVTTWLVTADAHGARRVGQAETTFDSRLPLEVDATLPVEVTPGDRLAIPVALRARDIAARSASLHVETGSGLRLTESADMRVALQDGAGRALVHAIVPDDAEPGSTTLRITARADRFRDLVAHEVRVRRRGFPCETQRSGVLAGTDAFEIEMPASLRRRTVEATLTFYPSPLPSLTDGLEGMLREPHGCFEQTSSTNYPNVLALQLLEDLQSEFPGVASAARAKLQKGYERLTGFECKGGGFEWWGKDPGHDALTAYGLMQFADMARVWDVDPRLITRTQTWLLGLRHGSGFRQSDRSHGFGRAPQATVHAYLCWALLATGTRISELAPQVSTIERRVPEISDAYELALAALALEAAGNRAGATAARGKLARAQERNGSLAGGATITGSGGRDRAVETTALSLLAWLPHEAYRGNVERAMTFLRRQRRGSGTFGGTQATILTLKALCGYATRFRGAVQPGTLRVTVNGEKVRELEIAAGHVRAIRVSEVAAALRPGTNRLRLELTGNNRFPFTLGVRYRADVPPSEERCKLRLAVELGADETEEGRTVPLRVVARNLSRNPVSMPIAILGLPAGLDVPARLLDALVEAEAIAQWERRGQELVFYWYGIEAGRTREVLVDLIARIPGTTLGAASRAYPYYDSEVKSWAAPLRAHVRPAK